MSDFCEIHKPEYFCSTNLNSKINSYNRLAKRILWQLGVPSINVEIARDAIYENISIAADYFTTYAGQTDEYLIFSSDLYERHKGIRLDHLFSVRDTITASSDKNINLNYSSNLYNKDTNQYYDLSIHGKNGKEYIGINTKEMSTTSPNSRIFNPETNQYYDLSISGQSGKEYIGINNKGDKRNLPTASADKNSRNTNLTNTSFNSYITTPEYVYVCISYVTPDVIHQIPALSGQYNDGIHQGQVINDVLYEILTDSNHGAPELSARFVRSEKEDFTLKGGNIGPIEQFNNSFDYDIMDYRKVNAVVDLNMGESTGINTLFTIEQTLAQQTYFSYAMGNYGFDLISWYVLKNWLDTRQKLLSVDPTYTFNNRTQILTLFPEPKNTRYWAVLHCLVEKPLKDILKEIWVQRYALALTKIEIAHIRGRFGNLSLFGGGSLNYSDLMSQGVKEKEDLERDLLEGATPGLGSMRPAQFFIG